MPTNYVPSFSELVIAKKVLYAVNRHYHPLKDKAGDMAVHLELSIEEIDAMLSGMCAAVVEADEKDMKKPYQVTGIDKRTDEGAPHYELSQLHRDEAFLEREDNRVNYSE